MDSLVSKSDFAKLLEVTAPRVTQLTKKGLPVREDGKIDTVSALEWVKQFLSSARGGWTARGGRDIAARAAALLADKPPVVAERRTSVEISRTPELIEQLRVCESLTSAEAQAEFFRVCTTRFGFTSQQAYDATNWFAFVVLCALEDVFDIAGVPDWAAIVGKDNIAAFEARHDAAIAPEISAPRDSI